MIGLPNRKVKKTLIRGKFRQLSKALKCGEEERLETSLFRTHPETEYYIVRSQPQCWTSFSYWGAPVGHEPGGDAQASGKSCEVMDSQR